MRGWLFFHRDLDPALPEVPEILRLQEAAIDRSIALDVLKPHNFDLVAGPIEDWSVHFDGHSLDRPDFILCRTGADTDYFTLAVLRHFERRGVRLVNGPEAIDLVADKLHATQHLIRAGLPVPRMILGKFPMDVDLVESELGFPVIVKTLRGTRGTGVLKCEDRDQFEDLAGLLASANAKADFLFQHYVRASHGRDGRVLVIGGRVVAAMERKSLSGNFKSNVSLGGVGIPHNPTGEMAERRFAPSMRLAWTSRESIFSSTKTAIGYAKRTRHPGSRGSNAPARSMCPQSCSTGSRQAIAKRSTQCRTLRPMRRTVVATRDWR